MLLELQGSEQAKQKNPLQDAGSKFNKSCERTASLSPAKRQCVADIKQDSEKIAEMPPAVRQIEISAEEAAMNGAPEGEPKCRHFDVQHEESDYTIFFLIDPATVTPGTLVAVDVVLSKDFLPSKAPQEELATVTPDINTTPPIKYPIVTRNTSIQRVHISSSGPEYRHQ